MTEQTALNLPPPDPEPPDPAHYRRMFTFPSRGKDFAYRDRWGLSRGRDSRNVSEREKVLKYLEGKKANDENSDRD